MQKVEGCSLSAGLIIPPWHGHYGAPLDGMSVTYGGKSISHVLRELGYVCLLDFVIHLHVEDTLERDYNFPITIS